MDDKMQTIAQLEAEINADSSLDASVKTTVSNLIAEVKKSPTDGNLEALAVVFEALGDSERFKSAVAGLTAVMTRQIPI